MEIRYAGSAIIQDNTTDLLFVIPTRKNGLGLVYTCLWLGLWLLGELSAVASAEGSPGGMLWLLAWTVFGFFMFRSLLWTLAGKEFIAIDRDTLMIQKKGLLGSTPKQYDTSKVKNVRVEEDRGGVVGQFVLRKNLLNAGADGVIRFEYGEKTIKCAEGIGKAEALVLIEEMRQQQYLADGNFKVQEKG